LCIISMNHDNKFVIHIIKALDGDFECSVDTTSQRAISSLGSVQKIGYISEQLFSSN
jgi:hypothetical protein